MKEYADNRELEEDLRMWGDAAVSGAEEKRDVGRIFLRIWERAVRSVEKGVFFPFLYVAFAVGMEKEEAMLLAAAYYCRTKAEFGTEAGTDPGRPSGKERGFSFSVWKLFWREESGFPGKELFYQADSLLFDRRISKENGEIFLEIAPQAYFFLLRGILPEQGSSGLYWYSQRNTKLPYLGKKIRYDQRMRRCMEEVPGKRLFYLHGRKGSGRKLNYAYLAAGMGKGLAVLQYEMLRTEEQLREMRLECMLHYGMMAVELPAAELSGREERDLSVFLDWMKEEENLFLLGEWQEMPFWENGRQYFSAGNERQYLSFEADAQAVLKDPEVFQCLTKEFQWEREEVQCDFLNRYTFLPGKMHKILTLAESYGLSEGNTYITKQNLKRAVLHAGSHSLGELAKKIEGIYSMEDLILPLPQKEKLFHVIQRVKNRKHVYEKWGFAGKSAYGNGVSMIFAGPPGTGKTMAAQAVASELDMELYRVELPAVVDKYIGEMEKKLNRIFEEAEKNTSILFFDEADVLFSKRTEIKESNDKYSNMEIAFLLQKMEEYEGVSILATNYLQNFDEAFRRRIHDIVDFPIPKAELRETMWRKMIPEQLPVSEDIDYSFLANQFQLTGSVIKNALLYGSFLAAESSGQLLTMEMILRGIAHELEKSGKKLSREDYGEYYTDCLRGVDGTAATDS